MANIVEIILRATDLASGDIKKINKALGSTKDAMSELGISVPTSIMAGFGLAVAATGGFIAKSVSDVANYNKTIKLLADNLSLTTEETSRVVQVADDFGISIDSMRTALQFAVKNGFTPTIDNLAKLSDRLKTIPDPTERAAELTKIFGRNWTELTPLLNAGGDAIRDGSAAIADNLVVTEEAAQASRDYAIAIDNLGDTWTGVKNEIGNAAIPVLTKAMGTMQVLINLEQLENDLKLTTIERLILENRYRGNQAGAVEELTNRLFLLDQERKHEAFLLENGIRWIKDDIVVTEKLTDETQDATNAQYEIARGVEASTNRWQGLGEALLGVYGVQTDLNNVNKVAAERWQGLGEAMTRTEDARRRMASSLAIIGEKGRAAAAGIGAMLDTTNRNVSDAIIETRKQITWLAGGGGDLEKFYSQIREAWKNGFISTDTANKMFAALFVQTQALQVKLGQLTAREATERIAEEFGITFSAARAMLDDIFKDYDNRVLRWTIDAKITTSGGTYYPGGSSNPPSTKKASGGPVSAGRGYVVGEAGPEYFMPSQSGAIVPNNQLGGVTVNITAYGLDEDALAQVVVMRLNSMARMNRSSGRAYAGRG